MCRLQLRCGSEIKLEPLFPQTTVRSGPAITSQASVGTATVTPGRSSICHHNNDNDDADDSVTPGKSADAPQIPAQQQAPGCSHGHQERALRYFSMTQSGDLGHTEAELNSSPLLERVGVPHSHTQQQEEEEVEVAEVRGRRRGGAREERQGSSSKREPYSPDRQQQHSLWRGESEPLPSWRAAEGDSQERGRDGAEGGWKGGGCPRDAPGRISLKQEQERSSGHVQPAVPGRRTLGLARGRGRMDCIKSSGKWKRRREGVKSEGTALGM